MADGNYSFAQAMSADGKIVVGDGNTGSPTPHCPMLWSEATGMFSLGFIGYSNALSAARGVSADGKYVVGYAANNSGFIWTSNTGIQSLPGYDDGSYSSPFAISADGSLAVGEGEMGYGPVFAVFWTNSQGPTPFFDPPQSGVFSSATGVSDDGTIVVGEFSTNGEYSAFRWTADTGAVSLEDPNGSLHNSYSDGGVSHNGRIIVGFGVDTNSVSQMFRWTAETGMVGVGAAPDNSQIRAFSVSDDGNTIVGGSGDDSIYFDDDTSEAVIWRPRWGVRYFQDVLTNDYHLDLSGWHLTSARSVSADGTVVAGNAINPSGGKEAWIATLDAAIPPQPTLTIQIVDTDCVLRWPTNAIGFTLETTTDGSFTNWTAVATQPVAIGTEYFVTNAFSATTAFFRLHNQKSP